MLKALLQDEIGPLKLELTLEIPSTTYVVMLGPSGAGKSHTLKLLAGLKKGRQVKIYLQGEEITSRPPEARNIVYLPQKNTLFPHLNVKENVLFSFRAKGEDIPQDFVTEVAETLRISHLWQRGVRHLSGGEAQRVALARAICARPKVLLLDEPLASLDFHLKCELLEFLKLLPQRFRLSVLHVTHDPLEASFLAERLFLLEAGRVLFKGTFEEFIHQGPGHLGKSLQQFFTKFPLIKSNNNQVG